MKFFLSPRSPSEGSLHTFIQNSHSFCDTGLLSYYNDKTQLCYYEIPVTMYNAITLLTNMNLKYLLEICGFFPLIAKF